MSASTVVRSLFGMVIWMALILTLQMEERMNQIGVLFMFAPLVVVPLLMPQIEPRTENQTQAYKTAVFLQPLAALIVSASFLIPAGVLSATFAIAWLPFSLFPAWHAITRFRKRGLMGVIGDIEETCVNAAMLYLPIGAIWLAASRLGLPMLGIEEPNVLLNAVHFHFAGFGGSLVAGLAGRRLRQMSGRRQRNPYGWVFFPSAGLIVLGPLWMVAVPNISPLAEIGGALLLGVAYAGLALITMRLALAVVPSRLAQICLAVSAIFLVEGMLAVWANAAGRLVPGFGPNISQMLAFHGWVNAIGFVFLGALGWGIAGENKKPPPVV